MSATTTPTIVKVQQALTGPTVGTSRCLVYAFGRRNMVEQPVPAAVLEALGSAKKGFFVAEWGCGETGWQIGKRVEDQEW